MNDAISSSSHVGGKILLSFGLVAISTFYSFFQHIKYAQHIATITNANASVTQQQPITVAVVPSQSVQPAPEQIAAALPPPKKTTTVTTPSKDGTYTGSQGDAYYGMIDGALIQREIPDYKDRIFYISGPHGMVEAFKKTLHDMGVPRRKIKADYFPGFA